MGWVRDWVGFRVRDWVGIRLGLGLGIGLGLGLGIGLGWKWARIRLDRMSIIGLLDKFGLV